MMFTEQGREHECFYSLKVLANFRSIELADFYTYDAQILCLAGIKHV
jgi:hypothetical protein